MRHSLSYGIPLIIMLALTIFPFGWLAEVSPQFERVTDALFASEAAHAVGHTLIFATTGVVLLRTIPGLRYRPVSYLALVLGLAIGQEALQLVYKRRGVVLNDLTDIATDLVAAGVAMALWYIMITRSGSPAAPASGTSPLSSLALRLSSRNNTGATNAQAPRRRR